MALITLHGVLAEEFPLVANVRLSVATVAEAIRALEANCRGFAARILSLDCAFRVERNGREIGEEELQLGGLRTLHIVPVAHGAGGAFGRILAGIALIGAAFIPGLQGGLFLGPLSIGSVTVSSIFTSIGLTLALSGISQLLSPVPSAQSDQSAQRASYLFDGAENTVAQGNPVPIGYGEMIIGSVVISASLEARDVQATPSTGSGTPGSSNPLPPTYAEEP